MELSPVFQNQNQALFSENKKETYPVISSLHAGGEFRWWQMSDTFLTFTKENRARNSISPEFRWWQMSDTFLIFTKENRARNSISPDKVLYFSIKISGIFLISLRKLLCCEYSSEQMSTATYVFMENQEKYFPYLILPLIWGNEFQQSPSLMALHAG